MGLIKRIRKKADGEIMPHVGIDRFSGVAAKYLAHPGQSEEVNLDGHGVMFSIAV